MGKCDYNRRGFLKAFGLGAASMALSGCVNAAQQIIDGPERKKPNVVLVLVDDLGWRDVGCYGPASGRFYETPNIDRLAADGMRFTDGYAACAVCSPTRAAVMTGRYPARCIIILRSKKIIW